MTGMPAMDVYPITSGMARHASVMPATISMGKRFFSKGRTPSRSWTGKCRRAFFSGWAAAFAPASLIVASIDVGCGTRARSGRDH